MILLDLGIIFYQTFTLPSHSQATESSAASSLLRSSNRMPDSVETGGGKPSETMSGTSKEPRDLLVGAFNETSKKMNDTAAAADAKKELANRIANKLEHNVPQNKADDNVAPASSETNLNNIQEMANKKIQEDVMDDEQHQDGRVHKALHKQYISLNESIENRQAQNLMRERTTSFLRHGDVVRAVEDEYGEDGQNDDVEKAEEDDDGLGGVVPKRLYTRDRLHASYGDYGEFSEREERPISLVKPDTIPLDPLRSSNFSYPHRRVDYNISLPYLGVLIDGGRHYFPIWWLKRVVDRISDMKYNLIHLRLTDDQAFNVLFESHPELAYPTVIDNPERRVWTVPELKDLVRYAKARNVEIMPEINVPGHAGAWAGIPGLVTPCPIFTCREGYSLPLNVTHPDLRNILTNILNETLQIFEPPFLHLGGDEVSMARPCFHEQNATEYDYPAFEFMLQEIINNLDIDPENVVRWEMTDMWSSITPKYCGVANVTCVPTDGEIRAGAIEQFWESIPYYRHLPPPRIFYSNGLYLDTMGDIFDWEVYDKANEAFGFPRGVVPHALIAGTFELSPQFWFDRNVLGRLLAISMGAANLTLPSNITELERREYISGEYRKYCKIVGLGTYICEAQGNSIVPIFYWKNEWRKGWKAWKNAICGRLTEITAGERQFKPMHSFERYSVSREHFWRSFSLMTSARNNTLLSSKINHERSRVKHVGVIVDTTSSFVPINDLTKFLPVFARLDFDMMILRISGNNGFTVEFPDFPKFGSSMLQDPDEDGLYTPRELQGLAKSAGMRGIDVVPEISFKTNAAGLYGAGFLSLCPNTLCEGGLVANDIRKPELLPVILSVVGLLRSVLPSQYLHLGHDDRLGSIPCFEEARINATRYHDRFERKLQALLEFAEIPETNVFRYANQGDDKYESRAGGIKHYPSGTELSDIKTDEGPFFVTVDVLDGALFDVYQRTVELMDLEPMGIVAELRHLTSIQWQVYEIFQRLAAFAVGTNQTSLTEPEFESTWRALCRAKRPQGTTCKVLPDKLENVIHVTETETWREHHCSLRTQMKDIIGSKNVTAYYSEEVIRDVFGDMIKSMLNSSKKNTT